MRYSLILLVLLLIGCYESPPTEDTVYYGMNVYTIDSCEYIGRLASSQSSFLAHKGNCKYCEARKCK